MNPLEAVAACVSNYANFSGRSSRSEFWWWQLATILLVTAELVFVNRVIVDNLVQFALLIPTLSVSARRLHDTGRSGWWGVAYVPLGIAIGVIYVMIERGETQFTMVTVYVLGSIAVVIELVVLVWYCTDGDELSNDYGPVI